MLGRYVLVPLQHPIEKAVSDAFGVSSMDLHQHHRGVRLDDARSALYRLLHEAQWSRSEIGRFVGGRNHKTICCGLEHSQNMEETDPEYRAKIQTAREQLKR